MKLERDEKTLIRESNDTHVVSVSTTISETRTTLHFNHKDAWREKENLTVKELGKAGLSGTAFVGAAIQGIDQIIKGFDASDISQVGKGAEVVLLASFLLPLTTRFINEARVARREKIKIKT